MLFSGGDGIERLYQVELAVEAVEVDEAEGVEDVPDGVALQVVVVLGAADPVHVEQPDPVGEEEYPEGLQERLVVRAGDPPREQDLQDRDDADLEAEQVL